MPTQAPAVRKTTALTPLAVRVLGEYREMSGLRLTARQAARWLSLAPDVAAAVLDELRSASILTRSADGVFAMRINNGSLVEESLSEASLGRLVCLLRHWTWADEALARFDREMANGWDDDDDPMSDHPFGAYYHWCALLCGFAEAALDRGLLSPPELEPIRQDIEASVPGLRACRQLLVVIPASLEEQPLIVDLLRDGEALARLRRVHQAFGEALRKERASREIDSLDP